MNVHILRRRGLGLQSCKGLALAMNTLGIETSFGRSLKPCDKVIRWGTRASTGMPLSTQVNASSGIGAVSNKRGFRRSLSNTLPDTVPLTIFDTTPLSLVSVQDKQLIVRPSRHAQGRNLFLIDSTDLPLIVSREPSLADGWYASEYIPKVAEHRVFVVDGRVVAVTNKTPDDPNAIAWNMSQGASVGNLRWDAWNLKACQIAIKAFNLSGLDFCGVDVMIAENGTPYILELNSAPTLMIKSDGEPSYRHVCMAKALVHKINGGECAEVPDAIENWRDVIHPAIWSPNED